MSVNRRGFCAGERVMGEQNCEPARLENGVQVSLGLGHCDQGPYTQVSAPANALWRQKTLFSTNNALSETVPNPPASITATDTPAHESHRNDPRPDSTRTRVYPVPVELPAKTSDCWWPLGAHRSQTIVYREKTAP